MTGNFSEQRSGRTATILSGANVQLHGTPVVIGAAAGQCDEPQIRLHRNGSTVTQIEVTCKCGERILLDCDYGAATPQVAPGAVPPGNG
ncbi:hypothetical protein Mal4_45790 [Maioricimonas rarisocia]|uniref:Uncharacterized protein n=1 Tax=Maioricimonas rarisocia TaxID=2528026 RepID=A0A517ZCK0_9PLAN|nr:hypothetical protein [Maioricimonas rarisocia]QDU40223.1 hypothetical protein Mal4_45790 [Maioricimonas rarisocia]